MSVTEFDYQPRTRIVFGPGKINLLGQLAAELGAKRAMMVSDPGIVAAGHSEHGLESLRAAGLETTLFHDVVENPTTENVDAAVEVAREFQPDLIVGLGGGSSMDCAKGLNFIYSCGGRMQDYWGVGKATRPLLPMIAVPTTSGTGSESQSFALISDAKTHAKMACGDKKAACRVALLDPELTVTQPPMVTALTGIDAIAHTVETQVTSKRNAVSLAFSREAWRLLEPNFPRVLENPGNVDARGAMQLGACFAGLAIENSMLGAAHAMANPLTQHFQVVHGQAVALMLPHVIRFNGELPESQSLYSELAETLASQNGAATGLSGSELLARRVTQLVEQAGLKTRLADCGVDPTRITELAQGAAQQWTSHFNPRQAGETEFGQLYQSAL